MEIQPVILSGGSGTRLWPLSRKSFPKQFINLVTDQSMFQDTIDRARAVSDAPILAVCNEKHRFLVAEQLRQSGEEHTQILLEPVGRNTAPAVALAALQARANAEGDGPMLLILASDHMVKDVERFREAVAVGAEQAKNGKLVTFGIVPNAPETGYGYIRANMGSEGSATGQAYAVEEYVEKPDLETAAGYVESKQYLWNSGMFLLRADVYLKELERHRPDIYQACLAALDKSEGDMDFVRPDTATFESCPSDSIDYAVMEKTDDAVVVPLDAGWNDVGAWSSLWAEREKDENGNALTGDALVQDSSNCLIHAESRLVAAIGLEDIVVVETPDAVLVAPKDRVQDVKKIVESLSGHDRYEATENRKVYRPWGHYDSIDMGERFQVKRITVNPGQTLSLQKHFHRAEHWIVVSGIAEITRNDEVFTITENESTYIPLGAVHRMSNPGRIPLELIEVQSGSYLGEDDIVRLSDTYGREGSIG